MMKKTVVENGRENTYELQDFREDGGSVVLFLNGQIIRKDEDKALVYWNAIK